MDIKDKVVIITGAASGIGKGLAERFKAEGAKGLVLADLNADGVVAVADELGAVGFPCDVGDEPQIEGLVAAAEKQFGPVDVFCSNAGILRLGDEDQPDAEFEDSWRINTMSHVYAARAAAPGMAEERFLIFPHEIVYEYMMRKANDRDRWLKGMGRVRERLFASE